MCQTDNSALAEGIGLVEIATLNKALKRDTAMLLRNSLGQQAFAEQQTSIGGMIAAPNGIEDPATKRLVIKTSPFDRTNKGEVVLLEDREWNVFDPAEQAAESMLNDVTPLYTLMDNDPIVGAAITPIVGKISEDDLLTYVEPGLSGTTWNVDATFEGFDDPIYDQLTALAGFNESLDFGYDVGDFVQINGKQIFQVDEEKLVNTLREKLSGDRLQPIKKLLYHLLCFLLILHLILQYDKFDKIHENHQNQYHMYLLILQYHSFYHLKK
jgi:hypothetical protein